MDVHPGVTLLDDDVRDAHELFRSLHAHPELSMQEHATAAAIEAYLEAIGAETSRCGGTGVVGILRNGDGPVVAFRADTDGLPILEETGLAHASRDTGIDPSGKEVPTMHGCGHDFHVAAALTTAQALAANRDAWAGTIVFVFQPGEETGEGARAMLADGLWERAPRPEVILGQHVFPLPVGMVATREGAFMSMSDSWRVTVKGRGAHGSQPQNSIDPIVAASAIVLRLQTVVAREIDPQAAAVVTVGTFQAGTKENIIPEHAVLGLSIRTFDPAVRERVLASVRRIILAEAAASGAPEPEIEEIVSFPLNRNDPEATRGVVAALTAQLGEDMVRESPPIMGSEDFGILGEAIGVPTVYWAFGGVEPEAFGAATPPPGNHTPQFAPTMAGTIETGVKAAAAALLSRVGTSRA
ncbi:amidohydrolase [Clavibacter tessellarius]|uniref:amidohydrolase n=1 Tax=Clavibacter tessellarius TaxID=31965 RepID=UPI0039E7A08D